MQLSARIARLADLADPGVQTAQEVLSGLNGTSRVVPRFCGDFGMCTAILVPGGAQIRGRQTTMLGDPGRSWRCSDRSSWRTALISALLVVVRFRRRITVVQAILAPRSSQI